jgi:hypothetical protein
MGFSPGRVPHICPILADVGSSAFHQAHLDRLRKIMLR